MAERAGNRKPNEEHLLVVRQTADDRRNQFCVTCLWSSSWEEIRLVVFSVSAAVPAPQQLVGFGDDGDGDGDDDGDGDATRRGRGVRGGTD